jgi:hypothetical protein
MSEVTAICTANGRFDLLKRTLESFLEYNTYPLAGLYIRDDSTNHLGQIGSVEELMKLVKTPYAFHFEEDWLFTKEGFIQHSLREITDGVHSVWIRDENDFDGHHRVKPLVDGKYVIPSAISMGFSFNPHLYNMKYYDGFDKTGGVCSEDSIGRYYNSLGLKTIWIPGYCHHIG